MAKYHTITDTLIKRIDTFSAAFCSDLNENRGFLVLLGIFGISAYGLLAFNPIFVADLWSQIFFDESNVVIKSGRWMMGIFWKFYFSNLFTPSVTTIGSFIIMSLSCYSIAKNLGISVPFEKFTFTALFVFCPILTPHFAIYTHQLPFALAFVLLALNTSLLKQASDSPRNRQVNLYLCVVFLQAIMLGIRQEFIFLAISIILAQGLYSVSTDSKFTRYELKILFKSLAVTLCSIPVYYLIWKLMLYLFDVEPFGSGYYSVDENMKKMFSSLNLTIPRALTSMYAFNFLDTPHWPKITKYIFIGISFSATVLMYLHFNNRVQFNGTPKFTVFFVCLLLYLSIVVSPWAVSLVAPNMLYISHTALIGLAPTYAVLTCFCLRLCKNQALNLALKCSSFFIIVIFTIFQNYAFTSISLRNNREFFVGSKILASIENHRDSDQFNESHPQVVIFLGQIEQKTKQRPLYHEQSHLVGWSLVNDEITDEYLPRISYLFRLIDTEASNRNRQYYEYSIKYGGSRSGGRIALHALLASLNHEEREALFVRIDQAPIWQNRESIVFIKNVALVKLSEDKQVKYSDSMRNL
jgi:hypothetical protein